jgi:D-alanyl-D-alanine carboxypeptidase
MKTNLKVVAVALTTGVALWSLTGLSSCQRQQESALKPIDQAALQTLVDTTAKELLIPGVVVLLRTHQGELTVSYGTTLLGATSPLGADTHFRIASNTKTMTAAVIVLLAQEGKLSLDDPVSKYVPGVPNGDNITITELLNMRSGLYTYDDDPEFWAILERDPTKVWSPAEVLAIAFTHPPYFPSGTGYHYSNTNYALLGLIAEKIDGKPLASCLQDRLFGPLGLKDTLLPAITSNTLPEPYSHGYLYGGCSFRNLTDKPYPPDIQAAAKAGTLKPDDCTDQNSSYASAGRRRYLDRQRSRHMDQGTGRRQGPQHRLSAPVARQRATRGSKQARRPKVRVRHQPI